MNAEVIKITLAIVIPLMGLVGWVAKLIFPYFLRKIDEKDERIEKLTVEFTDTINHKTTDWTREVRRLSAAIEAQTDVFKQLIKHG